MKKSIFSIALFALFVLSIIFNTPLQLSVFLGTIGVLLFISLLSDDPSFYLGADIKGAALAVILTTAFVEALIVGHAYTGGFITGMCAIKWLGCFIAYVMAFVTTHLILKHVLKVAS